MKKSSGRRGWRVMTALISGLVIGLSPTAHVSASPGREPMPHAQTSVSRARVASDVLMESYDPGKAWFPSSWWNSAVALQTIGDYMERTGDRRYLAQLDNTYEKDKGPFPPGELSGDRILGNFTSIAIDDTEWWGLTWVQAYDLTGRDKYLDMAIKIADYVQDYWVSDTCGGGVLWNAEGSYKNAVTNGLFIRLTAELHNRIHGDQQWLKRSQRAWDWFLGSGMINSSGLVNDGLTDDCKNNGQTVWSYNQGLAIGAGLELWRATHEASVLAKVRQLADAAIGSDKLVSDGVLTESCDARDKTCDDNAKQFKGIFMRYMMDLADTTHQQRYTAFVDRQAESIWAKDRDAAGRLGTRWAGGGSTEHPNVFDWRTQASALSALIATIPVHGAKRSLSATMTPAQPVVMPPKSGAAHLKMTLGVAATAPAHRELRAHARIQAPDHWTVQPETGSVTLQPNGKAHPARETLPLRVTVPAAAETGHHSVQANVAARPHLAFRSRADVLVARKIDFDTGTASEDPWLSHSDGSQSNGAGSRFADGDHHFVYRLPFPADTSSAHMTLTIDNEFLVRASADGKHWKTVLREDDQVHDGSNKSDRRVDLTSYLGTNKAVYVRVGDSFPDDGWGGRVYHVSADYTQH